MEHPTFRAEKLAAILLKAHQSGQPLSTLPPDAAPRTAQDAYETQMLLAKSLGPIKAWKVGAASPEAVPAAAPITTNTLFSPSDHVPQKLLRDAKVEAEIAYMFSKGFTASAPPLDAEHILEAIAYAMPAVELVQSRFSSPDSMPAFAPLADMGSHGALILGDPVQNWQHIPPMEERVSLRVGTQTPVITTNANTAGEPIRLLLWLVQHVVTVYGAFPAGTIVTTGATCGAIPLEKSETVHVQFEHFGKIVLKLK